MTIPVAKENTLTKACTLPPLTEEGDHPEAESLDGDDVDYTVSYNPDTGETINMSGSDQKWRVKENLFHSTKHDFWKVSDSDPAHASYEAIVTDEITLPEWNIKVEGLIT